METVKIDGKKIKFKKGALRNQLKLKKGQEFSTTLLKKLKKLENGKSFKLNGKMFNMTSLMKKRINFALVLMK